MVERAPVICALCGCELRGFADGVMVARRVSTPHAKASREKVLVCKDDDACGARREESARIAANAGE